MWRDGGAVRRDGRERESVCGAIVARGSVCGEMVERERVVMSFFFVPLLSFDCFVDSQNYFDCITRIFS